MEQTYLPVIWGDLTLMERYCKGVCSLVIPVWITTRYCLQCGERSIAQIPPCTCPIFHNAPFCNRNVHMCAHFCYKMMHCGEFVQCIMGFVSWVYLKGRTQCILWSHKDTHRSPLRANNGVCFVSILEGWWVRIIKFQKAEHSHVIFGKLSYL